MSGSHKRRPSSDNFEPVAVRCVFADASFDVDTGLGTWVCAWYDDLGKPSNGGAKGQLVFRPGTSTQVAELAAIVRGVREAARWRPLPGLILVLNDNEGAVKVASSRRLCAWCAPQVTPHAQTLLNELERVCKIVNVKVRHVCQRESKKLTNVDRVAYNEFKRFCR